MLDNWVVPALKNGIVQIVLLTVGGLALLLLTKARSKLIKFFFERQSKHNLIGFVKQSKAIYEKLLEARVRLDAARVFVSQFHNGEYFSGDSPVWRVSRTYETTADGVAEMLAPGAKERRSLVEDVMVQYIWELVEAFFVEPSSSGVDIVSVPSDNGQSRPVIYVVTENLDTGWVKQLLEYQGVKSRAVSPIYCDGKRKAGPVGFVGADFQDSKFADPENIPSNIVTELQQLASDVEFRMKNHS